MIPNDSIDFYPTPDDLADDMIRALSTSTPRRTTWPTT